MKEKPARVLWPASAVGRTLAARLAVLLGTGLVSDATEVNVDPATKSLRVSRPCYSGNINAAVTFVRRLRDEWDRELDERTS